MPMVISRTSRGSAGRRPVAEGRCGRVAASGWSEAARRVHQAGLAYLVVGGGAVVYTLAAGLVPAARQPRLVLLFPGLAFVVLFGAALLVAPHFWHRPRSRRITRSLVRVLAVTNSLRTAVFLLDAVGWHVRLLAGGRPTFLLERGGAQPLFLADALAAAFVAAAMIRALRARGW